MSDYKLTYGSHTNREDGMCLMEAVAYLAGEPHTDAPACACPMLTAYAVALNDAMGTGPDGDALRARYLHDLAPMLVGSRSTPDVERRRAFVLADHAVRVIAPLALESAGLGDEAAKLRALDAVVDEQSADAAAWAAARSAWAAARTAARAAAWAARAAAWAAGDAGAAADDAAWAAAWAAGDAGAAADDAAWAAARSALVAALEAAP
jgi:hypothetical protein